MCFYTDNGAGADDIDNNLKILFQGVCISADSGAVCECRNIDWEGEFCHIGELDLDAHVGLGDGLDNGLDVHVGLGVGVGDRVDNGLDADIGAHVGLGADVDGIVPIRKLSLCQTHISFCRMSDT